MPSFIKSLPLDTIRIILIVALVILSIDLYDKWNEAQLVDNKPSSTANANQLSRTEPAPTRTTEPQPDPRILPADDREMVMAYPDTSAAKPIDIPIAEVETSLAANDSTTRSDNLPMIEFETELNRIGVSTVGGQLTFAQLKKYPVEMDQPDDGYPLLSVEPDLYQIVQSGLIGQGAPSHHANYRLASGGAYDSQEGRYITVPLEWRSSNASVVKQIIIDRASYIVRERYSITNLGQQDWRGRLYAQVNARARTAQQTLISSYYGGGYYRPDEDYRKIDYDTFADDPLSINVRDGWLAMIEHYFITALVPPAAETWNYYSKTLSQAGRTHYLLGMYGPTVAIAPGANQELIFDYFIGPKHLDDMTALHPELGLSIDYGILSFLSKPLFWLLDYFHGWTFNWGWAIVLLTMVVRLLLYKPAEISYRSMARMREAAPEIQSVRERYKGNREQMGARMMEIYRKRKINPLSGCLPILLQIPVFIALYWMLLESVELRQAPWILWIADLSAPDPFYVLPIIMGGLMVVQQRLNPTPPDPIQQKVFAALPIVLGGISLFFPAGLVLYWTVNNALSIAQQWVINRRIHQETIRLRS